MAIHFTRSIISSSYSHSSRLSSECLLHLTQLPEHRRPRFHAARALLAETMYMLYGFHHLPLITTSPAGRPSFADPALPGFSISYAGNMVGIALSTEGECGLSMALPHNPSPQSGLSGYKPLPFSRNETTWIDNQNNAFEARAQLSVLRHSIAKLHDQKDFDECFIQLMPGAGRMRTSIASHIEALCDIDDALVWAIAARPEVGLLRLWDYSPRDGWSTRDDLSSTKPRLRDRIMRLTNMPC